MLDAMAVNGPAAQARARINIDIKDGVALLAQKMMMPVYARFVRRFIKMYAYLIDQIFLLKDVQDGIDSGQGERGISRLYFFVDLLCGQMLFFIQKRRIDDKPLLGDADIRLF